MRIFFLFFLVVCVFGCNSDKKEQSTAKSGTIPVSDGNVFYEMTGAGPAVLLVHAGFLDHEMWKPQVDTLSESHTVITIDLPAHGQTKISDSVILIQDIIKVILDTLKIDKVSAIGLSLGAAAVTDFALAYPERMDKLILAGSGIYGWDKKYPLDTLTIQYLQSFFSLLGKKDTSAAAEKFVQYWFDGPRRNSNEVDASMRSEVLAKVSNNMIVHKVKGFPKFANPPAIERLGSIKIPTLLIIGDKDTDYIFQASDTLLSNIRGSSKIVIPGAAHMVNMEKPLEFNRAILEFLSTEKKE